MFKKATLDKPLYASDDNITRDKTERREIATDENNCKDVNALEEL